MKKNFMLFAAALVVFAACNKEQDFEQPAAKNFEIYATVEQQTDDNVTKSSLSGTTVSWTANDSVKVFDESAHSTQMKAASSGESVTFTENTSKRDTDFSDEDKHYAIYPYSTGATCSGSTISFSLPATQNYVANSFAQDANVAVASFSGTNVASFRNACGVFKLSIIGNYTVSKIELSGKNNEKLNGAFTINAAATTFVGAAASGDPTDEEKVLTLNCGTSGVALSPTDTTTFYFVVPVGAFANGFVAKVYDKAAPTTYTELSTASANIIKRSTVKAMPGNTIVPPGYQKVEFLQSSEAQQYIDSNLKGGSSVKVEFTTDRPVPPLNGYLWQPVYINRNSSSLPAYSIFESTNSQGRSYLALTYGVTAVSELVMDVATSYDKSKFIIDGGILTYDDNKNIISPQAGDIFTTQSNILLFYGSTASVGCTMYYFKIWSNNILQGNFIPAICKSGTTYKDGNTGSDETAPADKPGMYDLKTGKFFVNQGTGADFTTGSAVTY